MEKEVYTAPLVEVRALSELSDEELHLLVKAVWQAREYIITKMSNEELKACAKDFNRAKQCAKE